MTTAASLLRSVCERPDDDALRLIMADALDDAGQEERAEFIRLQCELSRINPGPDEHAKASRLLSRYYKGAPIRMRARTPATLLAREAILLEAHGSGWSAGLADLFCGDHGGTIRPHHHGYEGCVGGAQWAWSRGFVSGVRCRLADWLARGRAVVLAQPVQKVVLAGKEPAYGGDDMWMFLRARNEEQIASEDHVPRCLWELMYDNGPPAVWRHPSREAALSALSDACVALAREAAGLPPLIACPGPAARTD
jgi:uncharacterized protein (TIGR02996 family)